MPRATKLQKNRDGKLVSAKAKSKDPACSAAASAFAKLRSGGTAPPDLYTTLAKCRAKARNNQSAANQRAAGNEGKAQVLERRADRGLTGAQRIARAKELIAQRKAKAAPAPAAAKPSLREQVAAHRKGIGRDNPQGRAWTAAARKNELASFREGRAAAEADPGRYRNSTHRQMYLKQGNTVEGALGTFASKSYAKDEDWMAARNLKARRSGIESGLRRAAKPPTAPAKPSALEQARSARAAKGDRTTRLKALAEKSMSLAESRATKAGSLSGAAQDRMIDRSMAAAGRYNRLEAARTPYTPPAKAKAPTPSRSTPERQAAVQAAKDRLFGSRLDRAFAKLEGPKGSNFQGLDKVRSAVPYKPDEFVQRLRTQRQQGRYSLDSFEGAAGKITPELKAAQIAEGGTRFAFLSRNNAEPYTPRKASTQAKAAPSLLEQARAHRASKGTRSDRVAAIAKRADKIGTPLLRKEQDLTKSFEGYTKAVSRYQAELPWAKKNDKGYAGEIEQSLSMLRGSIQQAAGKSAKVSARIKSLRNRVSPLLAKSSR